MAGSETVPYHEARWWTTQPDGRILCTLCPRYCKIPEGKMGFCFIRRNIGGKLYNLGYGASTGFAVDPIEKKPLNHFLPGTTALSFGTAGCNLGCRFCQNWDISKAKLDERRSLTVTPEQVVELAVKEGARSIAYTYNDPTIWAEFVIDCSRLAQARGIKNVMVTAAYIDADARPEVYQYIDAVNVDLKAFTEHFYHKVTFSHLDPILDTIRWLHHETDIWMEITTLLIPGLNDGDEELHQECDWLAENVGLDVPVHFTAFHPDFKMMDRPRTPPETLRRARGIALDKGLRFVYVGNVYDDEGQATRCPGCNAVLIQRHWYRISKYHLDADGACLSCGHELPGHFVGARGISPGVRRASWRP